MTHKLFSEIEKFDNWAQAQSVIPQSDRGGEWECNYENWDSICDAFADFMGAIQPEHWTKYERERILYIIARDNEIGILANNLSDHEDALILLTNESIINGHTDDKWQLSIQLSKLANKELAINLLDKFVNDEEENVNRIALMELAALKSNKVEYYCEQFWNRQKYGEDDEYQRIAVLHALKKIDSPKLNFYIELAKQDGRKYLVMNAIDLGSVK